MQRKEFSCRKCGACCRNLSANELYNVLNRGDGVCVNFDEKTNLCRIYETRPIICRVEDGYRLVRTFMTYDEYIDLNYRACDFLQELQDK